MTNQPVYSPSMLPPSPKEQHKSHASDRIFVRGADIKPNERAQPQAQNVPHTVAVEDAQTQLLVALVRIDISEQGRSERDPSYARRWTPDVILQVLTDMPSGGNCTRCGGSAVDRFIKIRKNPDLYKNVR